jgi:hypothetical protein
VSIRTIGPVHSPNIVTVKKQINNIMEKTSLSSKIATGLISGLVSGVVFLRVGRKYLSEWVPMPVVWALSIGFLLTGFILIVVMHRKEKKDESNIIKGLLQRTVVYCLALDLCLFGWQKILHLQMMVPLGMMDNPLNSLGGETLMWAFFKWSYPFTMMIASLQLICGTLLLLRKTRLLALIMSVPILLNIICLDYFYDMPPGVLVHAIILLSGIVYLISQEYRRLKPVFLAPMQHLSPMNLRHGLKTGVKLSVCLLPVLFFSTYDFPDKNPQLTGKYQVEDLQINGQHRKAVSPKDSVLTTVYMDLENDFVFEFNDYRYRYIGTYEYQGDSLNVKWRHPENTRASFSGRLIREKTGLILRGKMRGQELEMKLVRQK